MHARGRHGADRDGARRRSARGGRRPARARDAAGRRPGRGGTLASSLGGMLLLFIGAAMLVPVGVPLIARVVGWPAARFAGHPGTSRARQRDPQPGSYRLDGGRADDRDRARLGDRGRRPEPQGHRDRGHRVADRLVARAPVARSAGSRLPPVAARNARRRLPACGRSARCATTAARSARSRSTSAASTRRRSTGPYRFTWQEGIGAEALADARHDRARSSATTSPSSSDLVVGDRIAVLSARRQDDGATSCGACSHRPRLDSLLGHVVITQQAFDATFPQPADVFTFVDLAPGTRHVPRSRHGCRCSRTPSCARRRR